VIRKSKFILCITSINLIPTLKLSLPCCSEKNIDFSEILPGENLLITEFQSIVRSAWWGTQNKISPHKFKNALGDILPQFNDGRQVRFLRRKTFSVISVAYIL